MDDDVISALRSRYWSLVVTACEWRAFGVEAPDVMAARVFATLRPDRPVDLLDLFRAVDRSVAQAYRSSASRRSSLDAIRGFTIVGRREADRPAALTALSRLRERDRLILQHAYWDDLDPVEIAAVLSADMDTVQRRMETATRRFADRLQRGGVDPDDIRSLMTEIKPGTHRRRPSSAGA